jgi:hypothetical protein
MSRPKLFVRGDYTTRSHNPKKLAWVRVPVRVALVIWKLKHDRRTAL